MRVVHGFVLLVFALSFLLSCHSADGERYERVLSRAEQQNRAYDSITHVDSIHMAARWTDRHGSANQRVRAHYLLGCAYRDMGEAPKALECYLKAIGLADTTDTSCDYKILRGIYGQMATLYHSQNLPQDEIQAIYRYMRCAQLLGDTLDYINAINKLSSPYYLMGEKDSVLLVIKRAYSLFSQNGIKNRAAATLPPAIYILTERGEYEQAKRLIDIFENESKLFSNDGSISKGREHYYCTRGIYCQAIGQIDSAEYYFRKLLAFGYAADAYRGLLSVYRNRSNTDSIVKYSFLYESGLDSLHRQMNTQAIHQMTMLYNYSRNQQLAERKNQEARHFRNLSVNILLAFLILLAISYLLFVKNRNRKILLKQMRTEYDDVSRELKQLKEKDYDGIIAEKERREKSLREKIALFEHRNNRQTKANKLKDFSNTQIARLFVKKSNHQTDRSSASLAEWNLLITQFGSDFPATYNYFCEKSLSELEIQVCILLIMRLSESRIAELTDKKSETISNAKARANRKLFQASGASSLRSNLVKLTAKELNG